MKRLISAGIVSAIFSGLMSTSFAVDANAGNVNKVFALWNDNSTLEKTATASGSSSGPNGLLTLKRAGTVVNNVTMNEDYYLLEGNNTDVVRLIFGASSTALVVNSTGAGRGNNYRGITPLKSSISNLSYTKNSTFSSNAISIAKSTCSVNVGSGEYSYALGFRIKLNNKSKLDAYAMYDLTVAGKSFKLVVHSFANDTADTSAAMYDVDENGVRPYGGTDAKYANGTVIYAATLKVMNEDSGAYGIQMKNGLSLIISKVMKATAEAGNLTLNYNIGKDAALIDRYAEVAGGNPISLDVISGFTNEAIKYNIDLSNTEVLKTITDAQSDRWADGKKVYVYVVNKANLDTAASASATDGIINSERMIVGNITDGKVVFDVPAKYFDNTKEKLMVALKEIDVSNLKAIPGVSTDETTTSDTANEITAPIISDTTVSPVSAPEITSSVDESEELNNTSEVAATTTVPNTGLKDNLIMAIMVVMVTVSYIGCVVYKKQKNNA